MKDLNLPSESLRLQMKELAEEVRYKYSKKGLADIFDILSEVSFFIRKPINHELSGFTTYYRNHYIVFINTNFTLGHERFTGAHELYHVLYNLDIIKKEKVIFPEEHHKDEDKKADTFAAEFLMPEDYVKELFYKLINKNPGELKPRHIVILQHRFKVSYKAMLKRLVNLGLCTKYDELLKYSNLEYADKLQGLTKREGYKIDLILPSRVTKIPDEYVEFVKSNYENDLISYKNMKTIFEFIGINPEDLGYEYPEEEVSDHEV